MGALGPRKQRLAFRERSLLGTRKWKVGACGFQESPIPLNQGICLELQDIDIDIDIDVDVDVWFN